MSDINSKEEFKRIYDIYTSNKDESKIVAQDLNLQVKALAQLLEIKPAIIKKAFSCLYKKKRTGEDELALVNDLLDELRNEDN